MIGTPDDSAGFDPVQTINDYADYYGAPADLAQSVMQRESGGNHYDRDGKVLSTARGYRGLMGMHPVTAAGLGLGFNADDPEENVHAGLKYLGQNLEEFDGNQALALAGYHVGPHRAVAALSDPGGDPRTKSYVKSILGPDYGGYWHEGTDEEPSGPGTSFSVKPNQMNTDQSGESDQPQGGTANLKLPLNSFQQMLHRMLAAKDDATSSANRNNVTSSQPKAPWTQPTATAYATESGSTGDDSFANADQEQTQSPDSNATDQSQTQPPISKGDVGEVTVTAGSPRRERRRGQPTVGETDFYRSWYDLRETDPDAALNLAQYYLQAFSDSDPQRAQAVRDYVNRPRVTADLRQYVEHGASPTDREVSDLIAASEGFTPEEAEAYRREVGHDFYTSAVSGSQAQRTSQDEMLANRKLIERAAAHPGGLVSIGELQPGAIKSLRDWLQIHRDPWTGLTAKEQHIIQQKVKLEEGDKSVQDCFNRIVTREGDVRENVIAIKNLIDVAGGHDGEAGSPVWQLIDSIKQVTGEAGGQPLVHVLIKRDKGGNPLRKEFAAAFDAEMDGANKKYIVNDPPDKLVNRDHKLDSIRQQTEYSTDYPIHFANDKPETPERYFVHFDPASPYFRTSRCPQNDDGGCYMSEVLSAAASHRFQHVTASQVRDYLRKTGQTHE
jgi:hypothetical protein